MWFCGGSANNWWLRSANSSSNFYNVNNNGSNNNNNANNTNGVVFGSSSARQSKHNAEIGAVGEKESITHVRRTSVNICHDKPGRTLLAWRRLMVNPSFHAHWFYAPDATIHSGVRGIPYIYMTSKERHEARYQRRRAAREASRRKYAEPYDNYKAVFTYNNLYTAYHKCTLGVRWKASIQKYMMIASLETYRTYKRLLNGTFKHDPFYEFDIVERGRPRHIRSVTVRERGVQRCLCDNALVPLVTRSFIYDNGASLLNKGYSFSIRRIKTHLHKYYREHGSEGYVLLFDFSKFFDNVSHEVVHKIVDGAIKDERLRAVTMDFVDAFGDIGLGLGSQISQVLALASANELDHYIKDVCRIKYYGRYMDDGYLIHHDKAYLEKCLKGMIEICDRLGIKLNRKKTHIAKLSHGFSFLKARFYLLKSGKVVTKIYKLSVTKMRRKLKKFARFVESGRMNVDDVRASVQSWMAYAKNFNAWHTRCNIEALYRQLFPQGGLII